MTFAEQMEIQRKRNERRAEDLVKRQRLSFAEELKRIDLSFGEQYAADECASQGDLE